MFEKDLAINKNTLNNYIISKQQVAKRFRFKQSSQS